MRRFIMKTYLLTWNPEKYDWISIEEDADKINASQNTQIDRWSCGNTKKIMKGDRVFLLRQGQEPRGIVAAGWVVNSSYVAPHWDEDQASSGKTTRFVDVVFSNLLIPGKHKIIRREYLNADEFQVMHWDSQSSGINIPDHIAKELEKLWRSVVIGQFANINESNPYHRYMPEQILDSEIYSEGHTEKIHVNRYERNQIAREKCIEHYGYRCSVCGFGFEEFYGEIGKEYIHVHHVVPISEIGQQYVVDPIRDLRPVCANCHGMLHRGERVMKINELKDIIRKY
jgi:5-methylcytosine-specific restriction enzyme A